MTSDETGRAKPRPRLLFLGHTLPFPPAGGADVRSFNILKQLARAFDIEALYFFRQSGKPTPADVRRALEHASAFGVADAFPIPQEGNPRRFALDHLRSVASGRPYTEFLYDSRALKQRLARSLQSTSFDVVHVDSFDLVGLLPLLPLDRTVLAHHNVESDLLRRRAADQPAGPRREYMRLQARLLERAERRWCPAVALNVAVSGTDAARLAEIAPSGRVVVVPNGVDADAFRPAHGLGEGLVFTGPADWPPNRDAMLFFRDHILPLVRASRPDCPVTWIGRVDPATREAFSGVGGVTLTGYVDDVRPYTAAAACCIVPLRAGSGTRLKILDAWAMARPVVSTAIGCEGLEAVDGTNILIRDDPASFASAVLDVLNGRVLAEALGRAARETVERLYDWQVIGTQMLGHYEAVASRQTPTERTA